MNAGRELDALIAQHVFGWARKSDTPGDWLGPPPEDPRHVWCGEWDENGLPNYLPKWSTDIATAWEVVEKLLIHGDIRLSIHVARNGYDVEFQPFVNVSAPTAPHAICLAALKAVGVEVPD